MPSKLTAQEQRNKWVGISRKKKAKALIEKQVKQPGLGPRLPIKIIAPN